MNKFEGVISDRGSKYAVSGGPALCRRAIATAVVTTLSDRESQIADRSSPPVAEERLIGGQKVHFLEARGGTHEQMPFNKRQRYSERGSGRDN